MILIFSLLIEVSRHFYSNFWLFLTFSLQKTGDRCGVVLEHPTLDEEVPGSIHTGGTVLCP